MRIVSILIITALLAGCGDSEWQTRDISGLMPELQFELTDENGERVTADAYEGQIKLVFFGFTHCPDICPTTLAQLSSVVRKLPKKEREQVRILLVSVDPNRDTTERLREYTDAFGDVVIGLRGEQEAIKPLTKRYRVTYGYGDGYPEGDYSVSHSSAVFVFDQTGDVRLLVRSDDSPDAILADLKRLLD